jgi:hypothetical protein
MVISDSGTVRTTNNSIHHYGYNSDHGADGAHSDSDRPIGHLAQTFTVDPGPDVRTRSLHTGI